MPHGQEEMNNASADRSSLSTSTSTTESAVAVAGSGTDADGDATTTVTTRRGKKRVTMSPPPPPPLPPPTSFFPRTASDPRSESDDDDDDDDEVEILYVNPPPPVAKHQSQQQQQSTTATATATITAITATATKKKKKFKPLFPVRTSAYLQCLAEICHTILYDRRWRVTVVDHNRVIAKNNKDGSSPTSTVPATSTSRSSSSSSSSSKCCLLRRLFSWELGDDLGVVVELSRRYIPITFYRGDNDNDDGEGSDGSMDGDTIKRTIDTDQEEAANEDRNNIGFGHPRSSSTAKNEKNNDSGDETDEEEEDDDDDDEEEELDRRLELYCRLYFRKGPWFRLDDVFCKYYLPNAKKRYEYYSNQQQQQQQQEQLNDKQKQTNTTEEVDEGEQNSSSSDDTSKRNNQNEAVKASDMENEKNVTSCSSSSVGSNSRKKRRSSMDFFAPQTRTKSTSSCRNDTNPRDGFMNDNVNEKSGGAIDPHYFDHELLGHLLDSVDSMVDDIHRLTRSGFIRPFQSEEECGEIVGKTKEKYSQSLLTQDEQKTVLGKLGGGSKKRKLEKPLSNSCDKSRNVGRGGGAAASQFDASTRNSSENPILKQMSQQRAIVDILLSTSSLSSRRRVLPVRKHVDHLIFEKLVGRILRACSNVEYIPSAQYRLAWNETADRLKQICTPLCDNGVKSSTAPSMCIKLRESPLRTLRRCCRLYNCATAGPGDMRGDGTNAWKSLPDFHTKSFATIPLQTQNNPPPGSHSWHQISYPGREWRLRTFPFYFLKSYVQCLVPDSSESDTIEEEDDRSADICVFYSIDSFHRWELAVDLRANGDYLIELNDLVLYEGRKESRRKGEQKKTEYSEGHDVGCYDDENDNHDKDDSCPGEKSSDADFMELLSIRGRMKIIQTFVGDVKWSQELCRSVELDVFSLLAIPMEDRSLDMLQTDWSSQTETSKCNFANDYEIILAVLAVVIIHLLDYRIRTAKKYETRHLRPYLRHLCWEGVLSYLLWDIIPVLERRGYYEMAVKGLEVLLFGRPLERKNGYVLPECLVRDTENFFSSSFSQVFLSRRARGKAFDRLMVDFIHILRRHRSMKKDTDATNKTTKKQKTKKSQKSSTELPKVNDIIAQLTEPVLHTHLKSGQISFSTARSLARRLKRPLVDILAGISVFETSELGHRYSNGVPDDKCKYSDWRPKTDTAVANSMSVSNGQAGGRCSYVGFEDGEDTGAAFGSLNVEELAKEYYFTGRLPVPNEDRDLCFSHGGWVGWHDEGGKIRTLFRIVAAGILGMDWTRVGDSKTLTDELLLFLSPYQGSPFDLHVGAQRNPCHFVTSSSEQKDAQGFYIRRKESIEMFLSNIEKLDGDDLCALVYDCIADRFSHAEKLKNVDAALLRDVGNVRTYCFLAAALGGRHLADVIRCMFFDYRHYSGGLPDLFLCRARYKPSLESTSPSASPSEQLDLVDLGDWIGETFSIEHQATIQADRAKQMLEDRDDDFLGCSKVGDSGGRAGNWSRRGLSFGSNKNQQDKENQSEIKMPGRLHLVHNGRRVIPECMFVEVKSANDRLDARQEDWLNILDINGSARVCKFIKPPKPLRQKKVKAEAKFKTQGEI